MSARFHVIMPCSRPHLMPQVTDYWLRQLEPHPFELRLHVMVQGPEPDPYGIRKINEALRLLKDRDGWIMNSNDDTIHAPQLLRRIGELVREHPSKGAIVLSERRPDGTILRACPEEMRRSHVDGHQFVWRADFIDGHQFDHQKFGCQADGAFAEQLMASGMAHRLLFVDDPLINFNSLMPL